jgi:hypothetical protein
VNAEEKRGGQAHQTAADDQDRNLNIPHVRRTYSARPKTARPVIAPPRSTWGAWLTLSLLGVDLPPLA